MIVNFKTKKYIKKKSPVYEYSEEGLRTIEGASFSATLSSNVFSQSRLASNQRLMNQIGNLVTLQVGENQNWIKSGQKILKIKKTFKAKIWINVLVLLSDFAVNVVSPLDKSTSDNDLNNKKKNIQSSF